MSKRKLKKIIKQLKGSAKMHKVQANALEKMSVAEEDNPRIPRKKGQPAGSKSTRTFTPMRIQKEQSKVWDLRLHRTLVQV